MVVVPGVRVVPCRCGCSWGVPGLATGAMLLRGVPCSAALSCSRKGGKWFLGRGKLFQACLSPGENRAGQRPPPRNGQQERARRDSQEPQLTPFMLCSTGASLAHTCCSPKPPGMPIPLHAVCLKLG